MSDGPHRNLRYWRPLLAGAIALAVLSPEFGFSKHTHRGSQRSAAGHAATNIDRKVAPTSNAGSPSAKTTAHGGATEPSRSATESIDTAEKRTGSSGPPQKGARATSTDRQASPRAAVGNHAGTAPSAGPPRGAVPEHNIDLVTPDNGYGVHRNQAADKARRGNLRIAPLAARHPGPIRHLGSQGTVGPTRNAIGAVTNRTGLNTDGRPQTGPSAIGATIRPGAGGAQVPQSGAATQAGSRPASTPGINAGSGLARSGVPAHAGQAQAGHAGAQMSIAGINGTGMARPGSVPAAIGGTAKALASINGSSVRPKR